MHIIIYKPQHSEWTLGRCFAMKKVAQHETDLKYSLCYNLWVIFETWQTDRQTDDHMDTGVNIKQMELKILVSASRTWSNAS